MHTFPETPYGLDALEPHISRETMDNDDPHDDYRGNQNDYRRD